MQIIRCLTRSLPKMTGTQTNLCLSLACPLTQANGLCSTIWSDEHCFDLRLLAYRQPFFQKNHIGVLFLEKTSVFCHEIQILHKISKLWGEECQYLHSWFLKSVLDLGAWVERGLVNCNQPKQNINRSSAACKCTVSINPIQCYNEHQN